MKGIILEGYWHIESQIIGDIIIMFIKFQISTSAQSTGFSGSRMNKQNKNKNETSDGEIGMVLRKRYSKFYIF